MIHTDWQEILLRRRCSGKWTRITIQAVILSRILLNNDSNDADFDNAPRLAGRTVEKTDPNGKGLKNQA